MIQGAAYDQVMKFVENGKRPDGAQYSVTTVGNVGHGESEFTTGPYQTGGRDYSTKYTGTVVYNDCVKNIYDLEGNVRAWTTEADGDEYRELRGGFYGNGWARWRGIFGDLGVRYIDHRVGTIEQLYVK